MARSLREFLAQAGSGRIRRLVAPFLFALAALIFTAGAATKAKLLEAGPPEYPPDARQARITAWVMVRYRIMEAGAVVDAEVVGNCAWQAPRYSSTDCIDSPDTRFDAAALPAVQRYRYRPAADAAGNPISSWRRARVRFDFEPPASTLLRKLYTGEKWELAALPYARVGMPQAAERKLGEARRQILSGDPRQVSKGLKDARKLLNRAPTPYVGAAVMHTIATAELALRDGAAATATVEEAMQIDSGHRPTELAILQLAVGQYVGGDWQRTAELIDLYHVVLRKLTVEGVLLKALAFAQSGQSDRVATEVAAARRIGTPDVHLRQLITTASKLALGEEDARAVLISGQALLVSLIQEGGEYNPIHRVQPRYPSQARRQGLSGFAQLTYTVTREGTVRDVRVVENCASRVPPERGCRNSPNNVFDAEATKALLQFRYRPRHFNGVTVEVPDVEHTLIFEMMSG